MILNTDGFVKGEVYNGGCVLRDHTGKPKLCYSSKGGSNSVLEQELRVVELGMSLSMEANTDILVVASDPEAVVSILKQEIEAIVCKESCQVN